MGRTEERKNLKKLLQGKREAYEAVICQNYRAIYRFMAYLTGDTNLAEELTQETFTSAWDNIECFKGRASVGTWLHQIAYRKFIDSTRRLQRNAALMAKLKEEKDVVPESSNPLHLIIADEHSRLLYEAMRRLNLSEYSVIVLHYIQGLSFRQVAQVLDMPVGTVKWQTNQALKRLKVYLTDRV